ncbi:MAG: hypothetical protein Q4G48_06150 [Bacteroidia bacterium]|nr:hypothetical protein [Bacteroidia bacterium]
MTTTKKNSCTEKEKELAGEKNAEKAPKEPKKEISKLWQAVLRNRGTGKILDMKAVMK